MMEIGEPARLLICSHQSISKRRVDHAVFPLHQSHPFPFVVIAVTCGRRRIYFRRNVVLSMFKSRSSAATTMCVAFNGGEADQLVISGISICWRLSNKNLSDLRRDDANVWLFLLSTYWLAISQSFFAYFQIISWIRGIKWLYRLWASTWSVEDFQDGGLS
jgi:hypothetical protein